MFEWKAEFRKQMTVARRRILVSDPTQKYIYSRLNI